MRLPVSMAVAALLQVAGVVLAQEASPLPTGSAYDTQLGGSYLPAPGVGLLSRDRQADPVPGLYNICYINAFQTQPEEGEFWLSTHPDLLLRGIDGEPVEDPNWPGEWLLDISTAEKRAALAEITGEWIEGCAASGFQAVEPDNLDTWTRSGGLLAMEHTIAFAGLLAARAHRAGLAIAQKNAAELGALGPSSIGFDFAVVEGCQVYEECDDYIAQYGAAVLEIEYTDTGREVFEAACAARAGTHPIVLRDRLLAPAGALGHHFETC